MKIWKSTQGWKVGKGWNGIRSLANPRSDGEVAPIAVIRDRDRFVGVDPTPSWTQCALLTYYSFTQT